MDVRGHGRNMQSDELALHAGPVAAAAEKLAARVVAGDTLAFRELFDTYNRLVFSLSCNLLGNHADAADVSQEVFLTVYRRIHTLKNLAALKPWICRITITRCLNKRRQFVRRRARLHVSIDDEDGPGPAAERLSHSGPNPEQALLGKESRQALSRALDEISFPFRAAVIMRDIEGMSYDEIAETQGVKLGTVKSRIARGREELRQALKKEQA
jgi:RNA polymerase sigma-70 factor (ECF subfamily)